MPPPEFPSRKTLRAHLHAGREEIIAFRNERLRQLVAHAYRNVAYYRELFDLAGVKPGDVRSAEDLAALPITTKRDLKAAPVRDTVSARLDPETLLTRRTSGSTGVPFVMYRHPSEPRQRREFFVRARKEFGLRVRDRKAAVASVNTDYLRKHTLRTRLWFALGINRAYMVECRQPIDAVLKELERINPDVISGYPGALSHLAPLVAERRPKRVRPRLIFTAAETLVPHMRERIEEGFRARVFDSYGSHESGLLAWECGETGLYHVCDDNVIMEILHEGKPVAEGERGEVVNTPLHRYAMPFIRYSQGDIVVKGPETCPCGQPFSTIRSIEGRMIDYYTLPDGRSIHHYELSTVVLKTEREWIDQSQTVQEEDGRIVMRISPLRQPSAETLESMRRKGEELLGPAVDFRIELVDEIPLDEAGKFRVGRSFVKSSYDESKWERSASPV